ncbi:MAG: hypothetical protein KC503_28580 [Myxococcales bacterium]|nr:hypothetical protein [Myxococcales bacterium]
MTRHAAITRALLLVTLAGFASGCARQRLRPSVDLSAASASRDAQRAAQTTLRVARAAYSYCSASDGAFRRLGVDLVATSARGGRLYLDDIQLVRQGAPLAHSPGVRCEANRSGHSPQILDDRLGWTLVAGEPTTLSLVCWPEVSRAHPRAGAFEADLEVTLEIGGAPRRVSHDVHARFDAPYTDDAGRSACRLSPPPTVRIAAQ